MVTLFFFFLLVVFAGFLAKIIIFFGNWLYKDEFTPESSPDDKREFSDELINNFQDATFADVLDFLFQSFSSSSLFSLDLAHFLSGILLVSLSGLISLISFMVINPLGIRY
jgi:hypothetical protein